MIDDECVAAGALGFAAGDRDSKTWHQVMNYNRAASAGWLLMRYTRSVPVRSPTKDDESPERINAVLIRL